MSELSWLLYVRPGFEKDLAGELNDKLNNAGVYGYPVAEANRGFVRWACQAESITDLAKEFGSRDLIFARAGFWALPQLDLEEHDRITPLLEAMRQLPKINSIQMGWADTNDGKQMSAFSKKFQPVVQQKFKKAGVISTKSEFVLHLFWLSGTQVFMGVSHVSNESPWHMGLPRLKFPKDAPSRSTLKLEEAIRFFKLEESMQPGMKGVDLGACPGGWTYQLVKRHLSVQAIDNGAMDDSLMDSGLVEHHQADGFVYRPKKVVDWLVCDMVEKPIRVAELMADWLVDGDANNAIFNLKLPMKKRYEETVRCRQLFHEKLVGKVDFRLRIKHLYHDREEVTCALQVLKRHHQWS